MVDWSQYLLAVSQSPEYAKWDKLYTSTDVRGKTVPSDMGSLNLKVKTAMLGSGKPTGTVGESQTEKIEHLDALEGLRKYWSEHVLLAGPPGSGKTTALRRLLWEEATKALEAPDNPVPVLVELKYFRNSAIELVRSSLRTGGVKKITEPEVEEFLGEGRLVILLDGINELPHNAARMDLERFHRENPGTPMVFATRDIGLHGNIGIRKRLEMEPLSEAQIRDFVQRRLQEKAPGMQRLLTGKLKSMAERPLFLRLMCSLFHENNDLPSTLGAVFREFTGKRFFESKGEMHIECSDCQTEWQQVLAFLAFQMMEGVSPTVPELTISRDRAAKLIAGLLRESGFDDYGGMARRLLNDLVRNHLLEVGQGDKIGFPHQLIQEYYAADHMLKRLGKIENEELQVRYLNLVKWTQTLAICLELLEDKQQVIHIITMAMQVDPMLGSRLVGAIKDEWQVDAVEKILPLEAPLKVRLKLLGLTRSVEAVPALLTVWDFEEADVRVEVAEALGNIGSEVAVAHLAKALNDGHAGVRSSAAQALGNVGSEVAVAHLAKALNDGHAGVRRSAAEALGEIGSKAAVPHLFKALMDMNTLVRHKAAQALGNIGGKAATLPLIRTLGDKWPIVRRSAAQALGNIGSKAAVPHLLKALEDEDSEVRSTVAEALNRIGGGDAASKLLGAQEGDGLFGRREGAAVPGTVGSEAEEPKLLEALENEDLFVRQNAAEALGEIGSKAAVSKLVKALQDKDSLVRYCVAQALGKIGSEAAVPKLVKALEDEDSLVQLGAAKALEKIGTETAVLQLAEALRNSDLVVRRSVAEILAKIGNEAAVPKLVKALEDEDSEVRVKVAEALERIGSEAAVPDLVKALEDEDLLVQWHSVQALGNKAGPEWLLSLRLLAFKTDRSMILQCIETIQERKGIYNHELAQKFETLGRSQPIGENMEKGYKQAGLSSKGTFNLLHLSDLHFGSTGTPVDWKVDAKTWARNLVEDLKRMSCDRVDAIVISGDIAHRARKDEYEAAEIFLSKLGERLREDRSSFVIVPGNHDVDWEASQDGFGLVKENSEGGALQKGPSDEQHDKGDFPDPPPVNASYHQRFAHFSAFHESLTGKAFPSEDYGSQWVLQEFRESGVIILGFNSAWEVDHLAKDRVSICWDAFNNSLDSLEKIPDDLLKVCVWHHPTGGPEESRVKEEAFLRQLAHKGFRIILHGHLHADSSLIYPYGRGAFGSNMEFVGAGTFGALANKKEGRYPYEYHLIQIQGSRVRINFRTRNLHRAPWEPYAKWRSAEHDPNDKLQPYYELDL